MRTRFIIITLMALILTAASSQTTYVAASDDNQVPLVYTQIKGAAEARQDELLYLLEQNLSPEVMTSLQTALQLMQQAEEVDPQSSTQYYLEALKYFRETWKNYLSDDKDLTTNTLEKITEPDTPPVPENNEDLENEIKENKVRLLEKFQEKIEEKYASFFDDIDEMEEYLPVDDSVEVKKAFQNAQEKLGKIREKLEKGEIDDAIESFDTDLENFEDDLVYLKDKNESKTQRKIDVMNAKGNTGKIDYENNNNGKNENLANSNNGNSNGNSSDHGNSETSNNSNNSNSNDHGNSETSNNSNNSNSNGKKKTK